MSESRDVEFFSKSIAQRVHVCIVGDECVGKRGLAKILKSVLNEIGLTIGVGMDDKVVSISISEYIPTEYPVGTTPIVFFMYDICRPESFARFKEHSPNMTNSKDSYIIGNKIDLEYWRKVAVNEASFFARMIGNMGYIEVSVLTGLHIDFLVDIIIRGIYPELHDHTSVNEFIQALKRISEISPVSTLSDDGNDDDFQLQPVDTHRVSSSFQVCFIGIARTNDSNKVDAVMIASYAHKCEVDVHGVCMGLNAAYDRLEVGQLTLISVGQNVWFMIKDAADFIYVVIAGDGIPRKHAGYFLEHVRNKFVAKIASERARTAKYRSLDRVLAPTFISLCRICENLEFDISDQSADFKQLGLPENIDIALQNVIMPESIETAAEELQQQAGVFKKSSASVKPRRGLGLLTRKIDHSVTVPSHGSNSSVGTWSSQQTVSQEESRRQTPSLGREDDLTGVRVEEMELASRLSHRWAAPPMPSSSQLGLTQPQVMHRTEEEEGGGRIAWNKSEDRDGREAVLSPMQPSPPPRGNQMLGNSMADEFANDRESDLAIAVPDISIRIDKPPGGEPMQALRPQPESKKSAFCSDTDMGLSDPCVCCVVCVFGTGVFIGGIVFSPFIILYLIAAKCSEIQNRTLFDNVLADTENAFQTLAKALVLVQDVTMREWSTLCYCFFGYWLETLGDILSFFFVAAWTVVLILPSFFTILIVRTSKVETESKAFGVRQEVIRHEKKLESLVRWIRIFLRSVPMIFYTLLLPYILVFHVIRKANERRDKSTIVNSLMAYFIGVLVLQVLGAVRVYHSWATRITTVPPPPQLYITGSKAAADKCKSRSSWWSCLESKDTAYGRRYGRDSLTNEKIKTKPPLPPNTFVMSKPANILELFSLTLEFWQMASFALQSDPYTNDSEEDDDYTNTGNGDNDDSGSTHFWGKHLFQTLYVRVTVGEGAQFGLMWLSIGLVGALIILFTLQFLSELRTYGQLMRRVEDKNAAKESFFFSFTGAIVYGHGTPTNISERMRFIVAVISDTLFLVLSFQLLQVISCSYNTGGDESVDFATLRVESEITCWEGHHAVVATAALVAYAFYVPLSIMITPMLLQAPEQASSNEDANNTASSGGSGGVSYLKLYLMTVNVVKSIMLVVVVLGPEKVLTAVVSSTVSSFVLGAITLMWFQAHDIHTSHYSEDIRPCNIAFINYWKAASYTAAVVSALVILTAHALQKSIFPPKALTAVLVITWVLTALSYLIAYRKFDKSFKQRRKLVNDLLEYPFKCRDEQEKADQMQKMHNTLGKRSAKQALALPTTTRLLGMTGGSNVIPGSVKSPWYDSKNSYVGRGTVVIADYEGGRSLTELIVTAIVGCDGGKKSFP